MLKNFSCYTRLMEMFNPNQAPKQSSQPVPPAARETRPLYGVIEDVGDIRSQLLTSNERVNEAIMSGDVEYLKEQEGVLKGFKNELMYQFGAKKQSEEIMEDIERRLEKIKEAIDKNVN